MMNLTRTPVVALALVAATVGWAVASGPLGPEQPGASLEFTVTDLGSKDEPGLPGVDIKLMRVGGVVLQTGITDANGKFRHSGLTVGDDLHIEFAKERYVVKPSTRAFTVRAGRNDVSDYLLCAESCGEEYFQQVGRTIGALASQAPTQAESNRKAADLWKRVEYLQFGDQVTVSTSVPKANLQYFANVDAFAKVRGKG